MIIVPLDTNKWYLLDGSGEERKRVVNFLIRNGWECNTQFTMYGPAMIRLSTISGTHKLNFRTVYNEHFMGKVPSISAKNLLDTMMKQTQSCQEEDNMAPVNGNSVRVDKNYHILDLSFRKEMKALEEKCETTVHNIKMDNPYVVAVNTAIAKLNKQFNKNVSSTNLIHDINSLLSEEDNLMLRKAYETFEKEREALREKYQVAEELLNMADTYAEKKAILDKYTKDVL